MTFDTRSDKEKLFQRYETIKCPGGNYYNVRVGPGHMITNLTRKQAGQVTTALRDSMRVTVENTQHAIQRALGLSK